MAKFFLAKVSFEIGHELFTARNIIISSSHVVRHYSSTATNNIYARINPETASNRHFVNEFGTALPLSGALFM